MWTTLSTNPILGPDGAYVGALAMVTDITARRDAEQALARTNRRLQATIAALPDLMFELDADARIVGFHAPKVDQLYAPGAVHRPAGPGRSSPPRPPRSSKGPSSRPGSTVRTEARGTRSRSPPASAGSSSRSYGRRPTPARRATSWPSCGTSPPSRTPRRSGSCTNADPAHPEAREPRRARRRHRARLQQPADRHPRQRRAGAASSFRPARPRAAVPRRRPRRRRAAPPTSPPRCSPTPARAASWSSRWTSPG